MIGLNAMYDILIGDLKNINTLAFNISTSGN